MSVHCWEGGPEKLLGTIETGLRSVGSTCMLEDGHEGDHEWTPDGDGWEEGDVIAHGENCVCFACLTTPR
jgi:hypothetical protein